MLHNGARGDPAKITDSKIALFSRDGNRFSVIFYKNYDSRKTRDDPVLDAPGLVDEVALP